MTHALSSCLMGTGPSFDLREVSNGKLTVRTGSEQPNAGVVRVGKI